MKTQKIEYHDGSTLLEAYCAYDDTQSAKRPAIIVAPDWSGRNALAERKAEKLAELGYVGFALDIYGKGKVGKTNEEKAALMAPFMENRMMLRTRLFAALDTVKQLPVTDASRLGAIGFCFGGLCVLDLARSGADILGVVSFHGLLKPLENIPANKIQAKILVLQGHDDPMATPDQVIAFENEMTKAHTDWQFHTFGNTMHAFTNPEANDPSLGTVYNETADKRSWILMKNFLHEIFG